MSNLLLLFLFIGLGALIYILFFRGPLWTTSNSTPVPTQAITNFDECQAANFQVLPTSPRSCVANGITYVENVNNGSTPPSPTSYPKAQKDDLIILNMPLPNDYVQSPVQIEGLARGGWYFEASFPVSIYDSNNKLLGQGPAQAQTNWQTQDYVPFKTSLSFTRPSTTSGYILLEKDNPSGLPENADQLQVPINFK